MLTTLNAECKFFQDS